MSTNPFDDETGKFFVLMNAEEQYSLWPTFAPVPEGWHEVYGGEDGDDRAACLAFVEEHWTDLRPKSLREAARTSIRP
ncbi:MULTISPECIES: MbtH family protein [unclassified Rathayibacter]|uniref:MbtH family protein n=1 Tax=unclassified Rathayibacter TaxID=2609250 RepID=UPI00188CD069|nr:MULTISPECIES: MbtH family protein [unclassified Rathayibacter]MBF4462594.1 MbtH family protein [Rathayibacter sp. VKM Ac-2879]MBF4503363.1 MbtH family protein [Rathayibacter sp. VKM Ac-2878]